MVIIVIIIIIIIIIIITIMNRHQEACPVYFPSLPPGSPNPASLQASIVMIMIVVIITIIRPLINAPYDFLPLFVLSNDFQGPAA